MALTREIVRVNQASSLEQDPAWAIPLAQNVNVTSTYTGPGLAGFLGFNDVLISVIVDLIQGQGSLQIQIQQSADGSSWGTIATFNFTNDDLVGGGGINRYLHQNPLDQIRIIATPSLGTRWLLTSITALLGIIESAGTVGGDTITVINDPIWGVKGDLAVGTGLSTATRLIPGNDGEILSIDMTRPGGMKWIPPPITGGGINPSPYWQITSTGLNQWAPGNSVWDTHLYRTGTGMLQIDNSLSVIGMIQTNYNDPIWGVKLGVPNNGITLGGDTNLYRSAADVLKTDDSFFAGGQIVSAQGAAGQIALASDGVIRFGAAQDTNLYRSGADNLRTDDSFWALQFIAAQQVYVDYGNTGSRLYFGTSTDTGLYRLAAATLRTDATFNVNGRTWITRDGVGGDIIFQTDVNLYRSAPNVLRTDDAMIITGTLNAGFTGSAWGLVLDGSGNLTITGNFAAANFLPSRHIESAKLASQFFQGAVDVAVTFAAAFASAPVVLCNSIINDGIGIIAAGGAAYNITTTGFTFRLSHGDSQNRTVYGSWIAL